MKNISGHKNQNLKEIFLELAHFCEEYSLDKDKYGKGEFLNNFENEIAKVAGMEAGLFLPSGVMAQLIAIRIWADQAKIGRFACHESCHLIRHEEEAYKYLHQLEAIIIGQEGQVPLLEDLVKINKAVSSLVYELPMRHLGGDLPSLSELEQIKKYAQKHNIKVHIDGARVFEVLPYYDVSLSDLMSGVDSLFLSFYKGFGSTSGSMLLGSKDFIVKSKVWLRRHGGNLFQLYPLAIPAKFNFDKRRELFSQYYEKAKSLVEDLRSELGLVIVPEVIKSNMFHLRIPMGKEKLAEKMKLVNNYIINLGIWGEDSLGRSVVEFSVGDSTIDIPNKELLRVFSELISETKI